LERIDDELTKKAKEYINDIIMSKYGCSLFSEHGINEKLLGKLVPSIAKEFINIEKIKIKFLKEDYNSSNSDQNSELNEREINNDKNKISEDGELIIPQSPEEFVRFVVEYIFNEFNALNNAVYAVNLGQHDDRVAIVLSAMTDYKKALNTNNEELRFNTIQRAEANLTLAMAQISKEVASNVDKLSRIPKDLLKKLFCGMKPEEAKLLINSSRESLLIYEQGLHLMVRFDMEMKEINRIIPSLLEAKAFLESVFKSNNSQRLYELSGDKFWSEKPNEIIKKINEVNQVLIDGEKVITIEGRIK